MVPTQQGLERSDLVVLDIDQWLVVEVELAIGQRFAQIHVEFASCLHARVHLCFEEPISAAAIRLGFVQGHVGVLQQ